MTREATMSDERQTEVTPDQVAIDFYHSGGKRFHYGKPPYPTILHEGLRERVYYLRIPEDIKPEDALVVNRSFGVEDMHNAERTLAAAEQKHAALVEAASVACMEMGYVIEQMNAQEDGLKASPGGCVDQAHKDLKAALAQQGQPEGEWIEINEDGSNLPEVADNKKWATVFEDGRKEWVQDVRTFAFESELATNMRCPKPVRFFSEPHIIPDIPEYTAR